MKKCQNCKYYSEQNEYHPKYCLCLFMCESVTPNQKCINEKEYYKNISYEYQRLINDYNNICDKVNKSNLYKSKGLYNHWNTGINNIIWKYGNDNIICLQKIDEYIDSLKHEIEEYNIEKN